LFLAAKVRQHFGEQPMITGNRWFRRILFFAIVLALSLDVAWLFDNHDLIRHASFGAVISYLYFPGMMFSEFFVCGVHGGLLPQFICFLVGAFVETLVVCVIVRTIWRLIARHGSS
jgi:hypothetical protein